MCQISSLTSSDDGRRLPARTLQRAPRCQQPGLRGGRMERSVVPRAQLVAGHEDPVCTFTAAVGKVNGLAVAGEVLTALGGANVAPTHRTVFLPNDAAFAALIAALSEYPSQPCRELVAASARAVVVRPSLHPVGCTISRARASSGVPAARRSDPFCCCQKYIE